MQRSVLAIYTCGSRVISKFPQLSFTNITTIARRLRDRTQLSLLGKLKRIPKEGGLQRVGRVVMITLVATAILYAAIIVTINIRSANVTPASTADPSAKSHLIPRSKKKPPNIEELLGKSDLPKCGYGQIENLETASCEWATQTNLQGDTAQIADQVVKATLKRVVEAYEAGRENQTREMLERSLLQGHPTAQALAASFFYDGDLLGKNHTKAIELIRLSASQNEPRGQYLLAKWLTEACNETCPDVKEALTLFKAASKAGLHEAAEEIGRIHFLGIGVPQNKVTALPYIKSAAEGGRKTSQRVLGGMFYHGVDVPQSYELALQWLLKAANQGDANAMAKVGTLHLLGLGAEKDTNKGILWTWLGARNGEAAAQHLIGTFLFDGVGGIKERIQGLMWLKVSASNGDTDAEGLLEKLQGKLQAGEIMLAEIKAENCQKNMRKCGTLPWEWEGFMENQMGASNT